MTTIDHAGALAVRRPETLSDEHVAARALQVARRTALGVLGDPESAADIARGAGRRRAAERAGHDPPPPALDDDLAGEPRAPRRPPHAPARGPDPALRPR